ncbi:MAG: sugar phosphate isomerase/epimerase, partial [Thermomicrobiales bacterium]|nr:sugar phosphate isomerase/epimerase [Thermomicrobiales bacterium]
MTRTIKPTTAWWCLTPFLSPKQIIEASASIGYAGIEFAPRDQWDAIVDAGLRIVCVRGHNDYIDGLCDPTQHDRAEAEILSNLELARQYDIPHLVCFTGERRGIDDATGMANTVAALRRVAPAAEEAGVVLALELLNSKVDHPDYLCDHTAWGVEAITAVDSPAVKLL